MTAWLEWSGAVVDGVRSTPDDTLRRAAEMLAPSYIVLTAGNGGSSSLASHMAQALMKPDYAAGGGKATLCLTDNVPTLTAHANDGGWNRALEEACRPFVEVYKENCALVLFSSSGRSENIVRLARLGTFYGCPIIAFTGFDGGPLRTLATIPIHVDSHDYEVVEPVHDALLHRVQYHLRKMRCK